MPIASSLALPPVLTSPAAARQFTRDALRSHLAAADLEVALLVVSELVTNAVVHAETPCELQLGIEGTTLRVQVRDGDVRPPVRLQLPSSSSSTGRGMRMLQSLGEQWGVDTHDDGKTVWWELALAS